MDPTPLESASLVAAKLGGAVLAGLLVHRVLFTAARTLATRSEHVTAARFVDALRSPARMILTLLAVLMVMPVVVELDAEGRGLARHGIAVLGIGAVTWLLCALVGAAAEAVLARWDLSVEDNLEARRLHTQVLVLERTLVVVIVVIGAASILMTFPRVREVGASLLVSAGFAGLAVGLAARPVLENLIAGLQLAFTQPIRIDDVVIVEGEWGWVEEITATYVVVRIWDQRRLVVPLSRFMTQPFQNWTRNSAEILGTVTLHADYRVPVQALREELERLCRANPLWDGRVCNLQVTDATEHTVALRALVSAQDSGSAWDLRVQLREQLIAYLQREHPEALPRARVEMAGQREAAGGEAPAA
jgi:small-conductance mechanosensitive channel